MISTSEFSSADGRYFAFQPLIPPRSETLSIGLSSLLFLELPTAEFVASVDAAIWHGRSLILFAPLSLDEKARRYIKQFSIQPREWVT